MADLGEEAFSSQMKVVATFLRLLEELMRNKQQDLRYGTKTQRRGILGRMKDFVGGIFKKVYDGTFGRLSRNGKDSALMQGRSFPVQVQLSHSNHQVSNRYPLGKNHSALSIGPFFSLARR